MENTIISMPRIGDIAPDFESMTTTGPLKFSEYAHNSWTILFSHPADFTPVCTTEMTGFALEKDFFKAHETKLIGLSIDSIHAHKCAMPLDWRPGDKVIVPAPKTVDALQERLKSNLEMVDFYLAKRSLD